MTDSNDPAQKATEEQKAAQLRAARLARFGSEATAAAATLTNQTPSTSSSSASSETNSDSQAEKEAPKAPAKAEEKDPAAIRALSPTPQPSEAESHDSAETSPGTSRFLQLSKTIATSDESKSPTSTGTISSYEQRDISPIAPWVSPPQLSPTSERSEKERNFAKNAKSPEEHYVTPPESPASEQSTASSYSTQTQSPASSPSPAEENGWYRTGASIQRTNATPILNEPVTWSDQIFGNLRSPAVPRFFAAEPLTKVSETGGAKAGTAKPVAEAAEAEAAPAKPAEKTALIARLVPMPQPVRPVEEISQQSSTPISKMPAPEPAKQTEIIARVVPLPKPTESRPPAQATDDTVSVKPASPEPVQPTPVAPTVPAPAPVVVETRSKTKNALSSQPAKTADAAAQTAVPRKEETRADAPSSASRSRARLRKAPPKPAARKKPAEPPRPKRLVSPQYMPEQSPQSTVSDQQSRRSRTDSSYRSLPPKLRARNRRIPPRSPVQGSSRNSERGARRRTPGRKPRGMKRKYPGKSSKKVVKKRRMRSSERGRTYSW